jgi:hypothetical protein
MTEALIFQHLRGVSILDMIVRRYNMLINGLTLPTTTSGIPLVNPRSICFDFNLAGSVF